MAEAAAVGSDLLVDRGAVLAGVGLLVGLVAEVLQLDEEVVGSEELAEAKERGAGVVVAAGVDEVAHLAVPAAGEADETLGVGRASDSRVTSGGRSRSGSARWAAESRRQRLA